MAHVSKGKLHHLWSLYDVWDTLIFRENDRKAALRRKLRSMVPRTSFRGTSTVCTRPIYVEADIHRDWIATLDAKMLENYKGRVLRPDGSPDLDVAETYPHQMEVFDEVNFDRLLDEISRQSVIEIQLSSAIPMDPGLKEQLLKVYDERIKEPLVELVDGVWRRKGPYEHELIGEGFPAPYAHPTVS